MSRAVARRKAIYLELHPETRAGVAGGLARQATENFSIAESFADATAAATGRTARSVRAAAARGKKLDEDTLDAITGTSLDKGVEIEALASLPARRAQLRKGFTVSKRVAIGEAVEAQLGERRGNPELTKRDHRPTLEGRNRDIAAKRAGSGSNRQYDRAKRVARGGDAALVAPAGSETRLYNAGGLGDAPI
jgi:hypothetical protein